MVPDGAQELGSDPPAQPDARSPFFPGRPRLRRVSLHPAGMLPWSRGPGLSFLVQKRENPKPGANHPTCSQHPYWPRKKVKLFPVIHPSWKFRESPFVQVLPGAGAATREVGTGDGREANLPGSPLLPSPLPSPFSPPLPLLPSSRPHSSPLPPTRPRLPRPLPALEAPWTLIAPAHGRGVRPPESQRRPVWRAVHGGSSRHAGVPGAAGHGRTAGRAVWGWGRGGKGGRRAAAPRSRPAAAPGGALPALRLESGAESLAPEGLGRLGPCGGRRG